MANRICFISKAEGYPIFEEKEIEFKYHTGFALSQKQKSIKSMHESIKDIDASLRVLEISTKSTEPLGVLLSAFNLKFMDEITGNEYPIENIFQASKVFEHGGPYTDLLNVHPKDAKRDERLKSSGNLVYFDYRGIIWDLEPKTMFYDWIYIKSLHRNRRLAKEILEYNAFTDIEFNHAKSINCQARAAAIFVSLSKKDIVEEVLDYKEKFKEIYERNKHNTQISIFE